MVYYKVHGGHALSITIGTLVVFLVLIPIATAFPTVSVVPSSMDLRVGDTFTVNISVDPGGIEILGAQFDLNYAASKINATGIVKGNFLTQDGVSSMIVLKSCGINIDQCNYGETRVGVTNGIPTPGTLAMITFKAQDAGEVSLQIKNIILSDPNPSIIPNVTYYDAVVNIHSSDIGVNTGGISYGNGGRIAIEKNADIEDKEIILPTNTKVEAPKTSEIPIESPNEKIRGFDVITTVMIILMIYNLSKK